MLGHAAEGGLAEAGKIPVPSVEPLARAKVRYIGEPIAAVIAESRALADDAAELVDGRLRTARHLCRSTRSAQRQFNPRLYDYQPEQHRCPPRNGPWRR